MKSVYLIKCTDTVVCRSTDLSAPRIDLKQEFILNQVICWKFKVNKVQ